MAKEVLMPKLSSTMMEGHVTEWFKEAGDKVSVGEAIFEVMTDKIAIEVEAYDEGILLKRYVEVGEVVPVNTVIAHIGEKGEDVSQPKAMSSENKETLTNEPVLEKNDQPVSDKEEVESDTSDVRATPAARKLVKENHLDLQQVFSQIKPDTRLHVKDVETYLENKNRTPQVTSPVDEKDTIVAWKGIRKMVADQMVKSASTVPHVTLNAKVNVDQLMKLRTTLMDDVKQESDVKLTYTHLLAYFVSRVLTKHSLLNAHALEDGIHLKKTVNLGIATALDNGLIVPVVKQANTRKLSELAKAISKLSSDARNNTLTSEDLKGGTFTITSLGSTRVTDFNPIINVPEVAILGVGTIEKTLVLDEQNNVKQSHVMTLSLSHDHRAVDGYPAALFLSDLVKVIEDPTKVINY